MLFCKLYQMCAFHEFKNDFFSKTYCRKIFILFTNIRLFCLHIDLYKLVQVQWVQCSWNTLQDCFAIWLRNFMKLLIYIKLPLNLLKTLFLNIPWNEFWFLFENKWHLEIISYFVPSVSICRIWRLNAYLMVQTMQMENPYQ